MRPFTEADDVAGFHAAKGILTSEGGKASHAALVARGMGRPAVTGAAAVEIDLHAGVAMIGDVLLHAGDLIGIDGTTGAVTLDDVPLVSPRVDERFEVVLRWCDDIRTLGVRANADTPHDARRARSFGAEGIGLCRTEHMFMAAERQPKMQRMIMAEDEVARRAALALEHTLERVQALAEGNPMLGTRGVRLGLIHPEIYEMQVRAIFRAAAAVRAKGHKPARLEIMVPLVAYAGELTRCRALIEHVADQEHFPRDGFQIGTMIELPRACLRAGEIATSAEFVSFGTNDLTQTAFGFSRDDIEGRIVPSYVDHGHPRPLAVRHDRRGGRRRARRASPRTVARPHDPGSSSASAASTAATRTRSASSTLPASTTSAAPRSACRSPASRPRRRRSATMSARAGRVVCSQSSQSTRVSSR